MVDFQPDALNVVDALLNVSDDEPEVVLPESSSTGKRGGVGATTARKRQNETDLTKTIMRIGKRKHENQDTSDHEVEDDDETEDLGRTAINDTSKNKSNNIRSATLLIKEKIIGKGDNKRKGESKKRQENVEPKAAPTSSNEHPAEETTTTNDDSQQQNRKKKRRKVRSRQKNIRKDNRDQKPAHLIPGNKNYQGRPLTEATKAKLHQRNKE